MRIPPFVEKTQEPHFLLSLQVCIIKYTQLHLQYETVISQCVILVYSVTPASLGHAWSKHLLPIAETIASYANGIPLTSLPSLSVLDLGPQVMLYKPVRWHHGCIFWGLYTSLPETERWGLIIMPKIIMILNASPKDSLNALLPFIHATSLYPASDASPLTFHVPHL